MINRTTIIEWTRMGMRKAYGSMLCALADSNPNIVAITADVAESGNLWRFSEEHSNRYFNVGIAEQNMTGIACGMAKEGFNVFISSFAPFVSMRNYEAVRTLIGYMHLNVKVIALASGFSLGVQGNTHYCMEDISLMKSIPGMLVLCPGDVVEEAKCLEYLSDYQGPAYLRLTGIDGTPSIFKEDYELDLQKPMLIREGKIIAIIATGSIITECIRAVRALKKEGYECSLFDICGLNTFDKKQLYDILKEYQYVFTVEEHFVCGGLGSILSDFVIENDLNCKIIKIGIKSHYPKCGDYTYMLDSEGLLAYHLIDKVINEIR